MNTLKSIMTWLEETEDMLPQVLAFVFMLVALIFFVMIGFAVTVKYSLIAGAVYFLALPGFGLYVLWSIAQRDVR